MSAVVVLYRWRVHPDRENAFVAGWTHVTERMLEAGSLGSRLHRGDDGLWYAYAQWTSLAAREKAFAEGTTVDALVAGMREAVAERLPEIVLDPVADRLVPLPRSDT
jgi:quinol monooxygenase YgiN